MPFKASDIKVTIKVKKIISLMKKLHLYKFMIGKYSFFWLITNTGIYAAERKKSFPYIRFKRAAI